MLNNRSTDDQLRYLLGEHAHRVPGWMYVQRAGDGTVSFVGASRTDTAAHPLSYGSSRSHQFILGELVVRPHLVLGTDVLRGQGLGGLATQGPDLPGMLANGEVIVNLTGIEGL